jgi:hypothetical protein
MPPFSFIRVHTLVCGLPSRMCVGSLDYFFRWLVVSYFTMQNVPPNKSPEPTAVGAVRSAIAVHVASRRWLSFFR